MQPVNSELAVDRLSIVSFEAVGRPRGWRPVMLAVRRMSQAFGGVQKLAGKAHLNVNTLYRTLSPKGNPELKSLRAVLRAMGMQLTVRPLSKRVA